MPRIKDGRQRFTSVVGEVILHTAQVNPGAMAASPSFQSADITVPGAALGDFVLVAPGVDTVDLQVSAAVTAANVVTWTLQNSAAGTPDLADSLWRFLVLKPSVS